MRVTIGSSAVLLLGAWLAMGAVEPRSGDFVLEVPASYLSVGQQFQPRLVGLTESDADTVTIELRDANGEVVDSETAVVALPARSAELATGNWQLATAYAPALSLPHAGSFTLRASDGARSHDVHLEALPEPVADYGGELNIASLGLPEGAAEYLRRHAFAVADLNGPPSPDARPQLIVVGDPRLAGANLPAQYTIFWNAVAGGVNALLLEPPPPGASPYWPLNAALIPVSDGCAADPPLGATSASDTLQPSLVYDLLQESSLDLYSWDGRRLARPNNHSGYPGCHPVFSFRYGDGWVTVSTLPLLSRFQDVRARQLLMNLLDAVTRRKHVYVPSSPGLAWVVSHRLQQLQHTPLDALHQDAAVWYDAPPAAIAPAPVLVPLTSCWRVPPAGGALRLDLRRPQPVHSLALNLTGAFTLQGSADGVHWTPLDAASPAANGAVNVTLPAAGSWEAFRLSFGPGPSSSQVCAFAAN